MYIAIANAIYSSLLQGSRGGFPQACFGLDYNAITSDFTFTRNSFATRVNENGLIETVTNLGTEQVVNGDFEDGTNDWSLDSNWSVQNNKATADGTQGILIQTGTPPSGTSGTYKFEWTQEITSGTRFRIFPRNGNDTGQSGVTIVSGSTTGSGSFSTGGNCVGSGTFTVYIETTDGFSTKFLAENGNEGTIDNVSVVQVIEDDIPRIDYTTGEAAFLLEPISTNLIAYSEDISASSNWGISAISRTIDTTTSPDGTQNADLIQSTTSSSCFLFDDTLTFTIGNTYSFSVFAKKGNNDWIRTAHVSSGTNASWFDLENGVVGTVNGVSGTIEDYGNGWYRCTNTFVATQTTGGNQVFIGICDSDGSTNSGASGQNDYVWGMQVEELNYATSYIPTNGTTVTRAQETCLDGIVSANSSEGVLYWEGSSDSDLTMIMAELSQGDITNRVSLYSQYSDARGSIRVSNVQTNLTGGGSLDNTKKVAVVWSNNIVSFWANGSQIDTDTYVGSIPEGVLTALNFAQVGGAAPFYGRTKDLKVYCKALTDEQLIELTTI